MSGINNTFANLTIKTNMDGPRSYYQHENRQVEFQGGRGGGGQYGRGRGRYYQRGRDGAPYGGGGPRVIHDDDVAMSSAGSSEHRGPPGRFNPYDKRNMRGGFNNNRGGGRFHQDGNSYKSKPYDEDDLWIRITIPYGKKMNKRDLLQAVTDACPVTFTPFNYHFEGNAVCFYVESKQIADALTGISKLLEMPNGMKMTLLARRCSNNPNVVLTTDVVRRLEECLAFRYNPTTKTVNLGEFHLDAGLRSFGFHIPINRGMVLAKVMEIIRDKASNMERLDLRGNNMRNFEGIGDLTTFSWLTGINLERNRLMRLSDLDKLKRLPLVELNLAGNPLVTDFPDNFDYVE